MKREVDVGYCNSVAVVRKRCLSCPQTKPFNMFKNRLEIIAKAVNGFFSFQM